MTIIRITVIAGIVCLAGMRLTVAGAAGRPESATPLTASVLWYEEQEAGTDLYPIRIMVSTGFVRIDDDDDNGDFVLLDRGTHQIYSVNREEQSILVIAHQPGDQRLPESVRLDEVIEEDDTAPAIDGKRPLLISFTANDTLCYRVAAVPGLLDAAVAGLVDYARALGNRQQGSLQSVPAEMQTPCFLSRYVYAPDRHLAHGLPIQEWDEAGYRRALVNYRSGQQVDPQLFVLPEGYRRLQLNSNGL